MELKKYKIGDLARVTRGASLGGEFYATQGNYVRLTCGNFDYRNNCFKENQSKDNIYYTGDFKEEFLLEKGDIITPLTEQAIGLLGSTARIPESGKYIQSQDIAKIDCNESLLDKDFAFYLISSACVKQQLSAAAQQTKIRHTSPDKIKECTVWIPSLDVQKRIGRILTDIDNKIAINRQINDNLEEQLRLITSRYIFGSPYLEKKRIGEIATIKAGGDCPITFSKTRTQEYNIPIFSNGTEDRGLYGYTNKANIEGHSITVAARGTIGYCERRLMPFVPIIRLLAITPKENGAYIYLHQVIRGMKFKKNGSVQQQLTVPEISFIEIPYPHSSVLHEYNNVASPIVEMIERNINENEILTKQRDELLPLLMNGQAMVNYHLSVLFITKIMLYYKETNINFGYERNNNTKRFRWNESDSVS